MRYDSGNVIVAHECTTLWIIDLDYEIHIRKIRVFDNNRNQRDFQRVRMLNPTVHVLQLHHMKIKEKQGTKE